MGKRFLKIFVLSLTIFFLIISPMALNNVSARQPSKDFVLSYNERHYDAIMNGLGTFGSQRRINKTATIQAGQFWVTKDWYIDIVHSWYIYKYRNLNCAVNYEDSLSPYIMCFKGDARRGVIGDILNPGDYSEEVNNKYLKEAGTIVYVLYHGWEFYPKNRYAFDELVQSMVKNLTKGCPTPTYTCNVDTLAYKGAAIVEYEQSQDNDYNIQKFDEVHIFLDLPDSDSYILIHLTGETHHYRVPTLFVGVYDPEALKIDLWEHVDFLLTEEAESTTSTSTKTTSQITTTSSKPTTQIATTTSVKSSQPFNFQLSVTPSSLTLRPGEYATVAITGSLVSGEAEPIILTAAGLPSSASYTINPTIITPPDTAILELTIDSPGTYTVIIQGQDGGVTRQTALSIRVEEQSQCIIATAAFGSEIAPQVQVLRGFRDGFVAPTFAGGEFLKVFNAFYYSWSPYVAGVERQNPPLRELIKIAIYPLIFSLEASRLAAQPFSIWPEFAVLVSGITASILIGLIYLSPPLFVVFLLARRKRREWSLKPIHIIPMLPVSLTLYAAAEAAMSPILMAFSSSAVVLSSIILGATVPTTIIKKKQTSN